MFTGIVRFLWKCVWVCLPLPIRMLSFLNVRFTDESISNGASLFFFFFFVS